MEDGTRVESSGLSPLHIHVLMTMGPFFRAFLGSIDDKGSCTINHTFARIDKKESYYNQIEHAPVGPDHAKLDDFLASQGLHYGEQGMAQPSDHLVCYVYATHKANVAASGSPGFEKYHSNVQLDPAKRVYLVGTSEVCLTKVYEALDKGKAYDFECKHGYTKSLVHCTLNPAGQAGGQGTRLEGLIKEGKGKASELSKIELYQYIIHLQQALIRGYILSGIMQMTNGVLDPRVGIADPIGTMFCCPITRLQLHSMSLCMSDMTRVVRARVVELPLQLLMVLAFTSFQMLLIDPASFAGGATYEEKRRLFVGILSALTMDFKQCEYFSDLYVKGVQECERDDFDKQKKPRSAGGDSGHDKYYFEHPTATGQGQEGPYHCVELGLTEDNRQICTGAPLHNRIVADDCETSASLIFSVFKTMQVFKALLYQKGVLIFGQPGVSANNLDQVQGIVKDYFPTPLFTKGTDEYTGPTGTYQEYYKSMVLALAHCLSDAEYKLKFAIGSANAAAVGAAPELCGHCFCVLESFELDEKGKRIKETTEPRPAQGIAGNPDERRESGSREGTAHLAEIRVDPTLPDKAQEGPPADAEGVTELHVDHTFPDEAEEGREPLGFKVQPDRQVVEGTNWTQQHAVAHNLDQQDELYARITLLSAGLLEVTRCPVIPLGEDVGKGLVDMARGVFYQHIFILGNELLFSKGIYGVSKQALCSGQDVYSKKIEYELAIRHYDEERKKAAQGAATRPGSGEQTPSPVQEGVAPPITAKQVRDHIMQVSREETVPPWGRDHWASVLSTFYPCKNHHREWTHGANKYRFSFVHQVKGHDKKEWAREEICKNVVNILQEGQEPTITAAHKERINQMSMDKRDKECNLDVEVTNQHVCGLHKYITLENVFCSMGSVCFTCCVDEANLERVEGMIKGWIQCIQDAQMKAFMGS